jgi:hypothetical protein
VLTRDLRREAVTTAPTAIANAAMVTTGKIEELSAVEEEAVLLLLLVLVETAVVVVVLVTEAELVETAVVVVVGTEGELEEETTVEWVAVVETEGELEEETAVEFVDAVVEPEEETVKLEAAERGRAT